MPGGAWRPRSLRDFSRHELEEICRTAQAPERFADILRHHERVALGVEMVAVVLLTLAIVCVSVWGWQYFAAANRPSAWQTLAVFDRRDRIAC